MKVGIILAESSSFLMPTMGLYRFSFRLADFCIFSSTIGLYEFAFVPASYFLTWMLSFGWRFYKFYIGLGGCSSILLSAMGFYIALADGYPLYDYTLIFSFYKASLLMVS